MNRLIFILLIIPSLLQAQYTVKYKGDVVKYKGNTARHDTTMNRGGQEDLDLEVDVYILRDFESTSIGLYDSADIYDHWGSQFANSYKTDSHDSIYVEDQSGNHVIGVEYFADNKGSYPDSTCDDPGSKIWSQGSGEHFEYPIKDSIYESRRTDDLWYSFEGYVKSGIDWVVTGKFGTTALMGQYHGVASAPDSTEGFSHLLVWDEPAVDQLAKINSYVYYQKAPYDGGGYGDTWAWNKIEPDASTGDSAIIPTDEWFTVIVHMQPNTFTAGEANSDGFIEGWLNGKMYFRKMNLMFINGAYERNRGVEAEWWSGEFATFYGGCNYWHLSTGDETFKYDNFRFFEVQQQGGGNYFPEGDTTDRSLTIDFNPYYSR